MLKFYLSASDGGAIVNKVAFYTPQQQNFSIGDEVEIQFIQDYSLNETILSNQRVSSSIQHYLVFDISGSDLPQYGGLFQVNLIDSFPWEEIDYDWQLADWNWEDTFPVTTYDNERGQIIQFIPTSSYESSFETASYFTASLDIDGANSYLSLREYGTYYVYRGY